MTRDEVKQILMVIDATFPNFSVENLSETINAWHFFLADYDYNTIVIALKTYVTTSGTAFPPSVPQLIALTDKANELSSLTEGEAWSLVRTAIGRSAYNSKEEYDKLPPEVRKAVGSPSQLYTWAIDTDFNEGVVMSNFQRSYRTVLERSKDIRMLPTEMRALIGKTAQAMIGGA